MTRFSVFVMAAWASVDDDFFVTSLDFAGIDDSPNFYAPWGGEWAFWGGGTWKFSEKAAFNVQVSYDDFEDFVVVANVAYTVVPNFVVTPEIAYFDNFNDDLEVFFGDDDVVDENWGFFIRAQANFGG